MVRMKSGKIMTRPERMLGLQAVRVNRDRKRSRQQQSRWEFLFVK
jgi:hypothetical protein